MDLADPANEFEAKIISNIAIYGYQFNNIGKDKETGEPPFSYTIGFWKTYGHSEILIIGLHQSAATTVIGKISRHLKDGGNHFKDNDLSTQLLEGFECMFHSLRSDNFKDYLLSAVWLYKGTDFPVLQLVFQDENHHWPWDEDASDEFVWNQPLLGD